MKPENSFKLATNANGLAVKLGELISETRNQSNQEPFANTVAIARTAGEAAQTKAMLDGILYAAKTLLSAQDFQVFADRSGLRNDLIIDAIDRVSLTLASTTPFSVQNLLRGKTRPSKKH